MQIWDAQTGTTLLTYCTDPPSMMGTAEWSPDSALIASTDNNGTLHLFVAATGAPFGTIPGAGSPSLASRWSPDGTRIATCDRTGAAVWDVATRKQLVSYHGHGRADVNDVAWSPDSKYVASDAIDVQLWEASTGRLRLTCRPDTSAGFYQIAWSPDGKRLAVGSSDRTVRIFQTGL